MRTVPAAVGSSAAKAANAPLELYEVYLDTGTLRYAQSDGHVAFQANTYTAVGIRRSPVKTSAEMSVDEVEIQVDNVDRAFSQRVIATDFIGRRLVVRKVFRDSLVNSGNQVVVFDGRMDAPAISQSALSVRVRSWLDALHHAVPRRLFSSACNYQHYDAWCTVSKTVGTNVVTGTAASSSTTSRVVAATLSGFADNHWGPIGTLVVETGSNAGLGREVLSSYQGSNCANVRVAFPYAINSGDVFTLTRGCRKTVEDCASKYANFANYGGFHTVPKPPLM